MHEAGIPITKAGMWILNVYVKSTFIIYLKINNNRKSKYYNYYCRQSWFLHSNKWYKSSVPSLSRVWLFATPWIPAREASLSITNSQSPPKPMSIKSVIPSNHLILCRPLLLCPQSLPASGSFQISQLFTSGGQRIGTSASAISPSNEYLGLISLTMDWLDLLAIQGTLKSLLQHHSEKVSILWHSAFFMSNSHIYTCLLEKP